MVIALLKIKKPPIILVDKKYRYVFKFDIFGGNKKEKARIASRFGCFHNDKILL